MEKPQKVLDIFDEYREKVDADMRTALQARDGDMYRMMEYFLGFRDDDLNEAQVYAGKRFRSGLCLLLADMYGKAEEARPAATAIELFHNFTLIHDDIVDRDELRRGRDTIWKKWGTDHAINTGDTQLLLSLESMVVYTASNPKVGSKLMRHLMDQFILVHEGQYMDFEMSKRPLGDSFNTLERYYDMITKKTSVLVGAATKAAGIVAELDQDEIEGLWEYGYHLGVAYQLSDDVVSIWGDSTLTGKVAHNDIREKKKTLPVFYALEHAVDADKEKLLDLYSMEGPLNNSDTLEVIAILDRAGAHAYARGEILSHAKRAAEATQNLDLEKEQKERLLNIVDALLPDVQ